MDLIKLYDLDDLLRLDASYSKIFKYFDNHYDQIKYILDNKLQDYYYYIGQYPNLKSDDLKYCESIKQPRMINALLYNPNVSPEWLEQKVKSKDKSIVYLALKHKNIPLKVINKFFQDPEKNKTEITILLSNPSCPEKYMIDNFDVNEPKNINNQQPMLLAISKNKNIPFEIFRNIINKYVMGDTRIINVLKFGKITTEKLDFLYLTFKTKNAERDLLVKLLSENSELATSDELQEFIVDFMYKEMNRTWTEPILQNLIPVANKESIEDLYSKFTWQKIKDLIGNKNTPINYAWTILSNMMFRSHKIMIDDLYPFDFNEDQLKDLIREANSYAKNTKDKSYINLLMTVYKDRLSYSLLSSLYNETKDDIFLSDEAKDIFIF